MRSSCSEYRSCFLTEHCLKWGKTSALLSNYQITPKFFYCSIWSTSSKDWKIADWMIKRSPFFFFLVVTLQSFILKSMRDSEPSAVEKWKPTGWYSGGRGEMGVVGSSLTLLVDLGQGEEGSVSQPSIPKSSVNFLTFSRSSVLTVGLVVDRERSMSDCKWKRDRVILVSRHLFYPHN